MLSSQSNHTYVNDTYIKKNLNSRSICLSDDHYTLKEKICKIVDITVLFCKTEIKNKYLKMYQFISAMRKMWKDVHW